MTRWTLLGAAFAGALLASASATSAVAASAVTFVSLTGRDSGACTRAAPCRRFRYAITQTTPGGTIAALDRAGYGSVSITQSVTIIGPGKGAAGMSPIERTNNNTGIDINAPGGTVVLRGLEINGGYNGIIIEHAASVVISDNVITGSSNLAINVQDTSASVLVQDTTIQNAPIYSSGAIFLAKRLTISGSSGFGIFSEGGQAVLDDCNITGSGQVGFRTASSVPAIIKHSVLSYSHFRGVDVLGSSTGYLDTTTTNGNTDFGVGSYGTVYSYGNNNLPDGVQGVITPISGD